MLRPSSASPSCVELRSSCFNGHASEPRLSRLPPQPPHQTPAVTPRPRSARPSPSTPAAGRNVRPATSGGEGWARARARRSSMAAAAANAQWPPPRAVVRGRWSHIASNTPLDSASAVYACAWDEAGSGGSGAARPATVAMGRRNSARRSSLGGESPLARRPTITCNTAGASDAAGAAGAPQGHSAVAMGRRNSARRSSLGGESPLARRPTITCNAANDAAGYSRAAEVGGPQTAALGRRRSARRASLGGESPLARRPTIASAAGSAASSGEHPGADLGANGPSSGDGAEASPPQQEPNGDVSPAGAGVAAALRLRSGGAAGRHGSVDSVRDSWGLDERLSAGLARPGCSRPEV